MESLKQKMIELRDSLETSNTRAEQARYNLTLTQDRMENAEERAQSLNRRLEMTQLQLDRIMLNLEEASQKVENTSAICARTHDEIQQLVVKDEETMQKENELKVKLKEANNFETEAQLECEAAKRKLKVNEIKKLQADQRIEKLEDKERKINENLISLNAQLEKASLRATRINKTNELENRILSLKKKCMEADLRREEAERNVQRLLHELSALENESEMIEASKKEAEDELRMVMDHLNTE
ncbi:tropomyosin-like [Actinia tenebrosa]|uniref:Tropomyosin-like n=1 Tax=Actinia tenebrosa TaxID=6105 RepID=A0A6P8IBY2_ACTTE|nr:tropomyosin-like [Actinia tenebrosa]